MSFLMHNTGAKFQLPKPIVSKDIHDAVNTDDVVIFNLRNTKKTWISMERQKISQTKKKPSFLVLKGLLD